MSIDIDIINEESTPTLTITFLDENGDPAAPSTASYSIWCETNNEEVRATTSITPAASVNIELTSDDTAIINQENNIERKLITIIATYGIDGKQTQTKRFVVKNLKKIS